LKQIKCKIKQQAPLHTTDNKHKVTRLSYIRRWLIYHQFKTLQSISVDCVFCEDVFVSLMWSNFGIYKTQDISNKTYISSTWVHLRILVGSCYSIFSFVCMSCRSLFVPLYFFFWPLCCLFFFEIRILITPLVSSNSSYNKMFVPTTHLAQK
jgi:hypothetical protein